MWMLPSRDSPEVTASWLAISAMFATFDLIRVKGVRVCISL